MFDNAFVFVFNGKLSQKAISGTKLSQNQGMPKCERMKDVIEVEER